LWFFNARANLCAVSLIFLGSVAAPAQQSDELPSGFQTNSLTVVRSADAHRPFTVAGPTGAIFGSQDGGFEAWLFPVKVLSRFSITAEIAGNPSPVKLATHASTIEVGPASTTITYSHAAFTIRQRMFAAREGELAAAVLFEIDSIRPLVLTFRFQPDMQLMWPAENPGRPLAESVRDRTMSYYLLQTNDHKLSAAVAIPPAQSSAVLPHRALAANQVLEFRLAFDPRKDSGRVFPLLLAVGPRNTDFAKRLAGLDAVVNEGLRRNRRLLETLFRHPSDQRNTRS
jgi:hypothetical protein